MGPSAGDGLSQEHEDMYEGRRAEDTGTDAALSAVKQAPRPDREGGRDGTRGCGGGGAGRAPRATLHSTRHPRRSWAR